MRAGTGPGCLDHVGEQQSPINLKHAVPALSALRLDGAGPAEGPPPEAFTLRELLPAGGHYRCEGSLTAAGYDENVSWVVMKEVVAVTDPRLAAFIRAHADGARAPFPLHRRFVLSCD